MKKQKTAVKNPAADLVAEMLERTVELDGREMTLREAVLRGIYRKSLAGDINASIELQDLRDRSGVKDGPGRVGCLVVPEPMGLEEFSRFIYEQQRPFREAK